MKELECTHVAGSKDGADRLGGRAIDDASAKVIDRWSKRGGRAAAGYCHFDHIGHDISSGKEGFSGQGCAAIIVEERERAVVVTDAQAGGRRGAGKRGGARWAQADVADSWVCAKCRLVQEGAEEIGRRRGWSGAGKVAVLQACSAVTISTLAGIVSDWIDSSTLKC